MIATASYVCLNCKKPIVETYERQYATDIQPKVAICKTCSINILRERLGLCERPIEGGHDGNV